MVEVIPGILEQEFAKIVDKVRLVENYSPWIHIDLLDGTLFSNNCFHDPSAFSSLRTLSKFELHMMVVNPHQLVEEWAEVGIKRFIGHVEGISDLEQFIATVRKKKLEVGLALDIDTDVSLIEPFLPNIDVALVMSIHTGKSGQQFEDKAVIKMRKIRMLAPELPIEVDGGINLDTAKKAVAGGVNRLVSTSFIFSYPSIPLAIEKLRKSDNS